MRLTTLFLFAMLSVVPLSASSIQFTFTGVNGTTAFGYYVGPYSGQLGSTLVPLYCDDFANEVNFGQAWRANLSTITAGSDLSATRYGTTKNALQLYQEIAWLDSQYSTQPTSQYGDIQATVWDIFDPQQAPTPSSNYWLQQAQKNYSNIAFDSFRVVTNVGPVLATGQVQEFLTILTPAQMVGAVQAPEPGSMAMLMTGGLVAGGLLYARSAKLRRRRKPK